MDFSIKWSPEAVEDTELIAEYIARDSDFYARSVVTKILNTSRKISQHPYICRIVPEIKNENIRELFIYNYRLIYKINNHTITIVAVIHGKRLLENIPDRF
ncbi:MAG: type II toxin-antitoxin system RelE/ParE family toxin [Melioribacteraceae bacterium]|nr:type II toxin-antitoxin system RelE/ParE family toxin [Melioribacteraceae bacterium]